MNRLEKKYLAEAGKIVEPRTPVTGETKWNCPANIALVKYWGKKPVQLPLNPSLSFSLMESRTVMQIRYAVDAGLKGMSLDYVFEDKENKEFEERIRRYLGQISRFLPFLQHARLHIQSHNTFPHSTGIASSASAFGALALSMCQLESEIFGTLPEGNLFSQKASFLARLGSGSAARSVYPGFVLWGKMTGFKTSADESAIPLDSDVHPVFRTLCDSILVVSTQKKQVSSSEGHEHMEDHPFGRDRIKQAGFNLGRILHALQAGDEVEFTRVVEEEALTLQALMMTARRGYWLMKSNTLEIIRLIQEFRHNEKLPVCFTLDAGPNVHLLYPEMCRDKIQSFIQSGLLQLCENGKVIHDKVGNGPVKLQ
jgi:diphosphomevalonate decarboxylase